MIRLHVTLKYLWSCSHQANPIHSNHSYSESVIRDDLFFFFHQCRQFSGGGSTILRDVVINLVRERRAIYDSSDPMHRDRDGRIRQQKLYARRHLVLFSYAGCSQLHEHFKLFIAHPIIIMKLLRFFFFFQICE